MTKQASLLDKATESVTLCDKRAYDLALYVAHGENPLEALHRIRTYLYTLMDGPGLALAVVALDRVLDEFKGYHFRWTLEGK